jgi:hypothetical protein
MSFELGLAFLGFGIFCFLLGFHLGNIVGEGNERYRHGQGGQGGQGQSKTTTRSKSE